MSGVLRTERRIWARPDVGTLLVAGALVLAVLIQLPGLSAGFVSDDYVYLEAARRMGFWEYTRISFDPGATAQDFYFAGSFYRPLYFFSFWGLERLLGGSAVSYHILLLTIHLLTVVLVATLATRLGKSRLAGGVAALLFAAHPVPFDAVAWVSSLNIVALPLGLASVFAYLEASQRSAGGEIRRAQRPALGDLARLP